MANFYIETSSINVFCFKNGLVGFANEPGISSSSRAWLVPSLTYMPHSTAYMGAAPPLSIQNIIFSPRNCWEILSFISSTEMPSSVVKCVCPYMTTVRNSTEFCLALRTHICSLIYFFQCVFVFFLGNLVCGRGYILSVESFLYSRYWRMHCPWSRLYYCHCSTSLSKLTWGNQQEVSVAWRADMRALLLSLLLVSFWKHFV